jgi:hypothetical protein
MTTIRYLTAAEWGGVWARPPVAEKMPDLETYVHHTGAPGVPWAQDDAIAEFLRLNNYAINSKGYSFLDYDVLTHYSQSQDVLPIGEGRGKWLSAATRDRNEEGEAVLLCGNFDLRAPLPIEVEGVALGIKYGIDNGWIARDAQILGHRDNPAHPGATSCPGDNLYAQLPAIRARVAELLAPPPPSPVEVPEVITPEDRALIVADVQAALAPQLAVLATKNDWKTKLDTDPSGVPWPADVMLGWLRRDVVSLKLGLLGEAQAGTIAQIAEAVAARVDSEVSAEDLARELIAQLAG